ncbi:uncharacterized protein LOC135692541 isoform X2 [Rhopilema esculentum]|uniref:uncharacterized protein LOC135692541 isoform X2 n=1 Tax=Rhopilema esculentum TaxID=499914 RepID=UPI0031DBC6B3
MASKKSGLDDAKKRIQGKLSDISEQVKILQEIINSAKDEAEKAGADLLQLKSKTKFFQKFPTVSQKLDGSLTRLLLIKDAIYSLDEENSASGDSEDGYSNIETHSEASTHLAASVVTGVETVVTGIEIIVKEKESDKEKPVVQDVAKEQRSQQVKEKKQQVEKNSDSVVAYVAKEQRPQPEPVQEEKQQVENKLDPVDEDFKGQKLKELISANYAPSEDSSTAEAPSRKAQRSLSISPLPPVFQRVIADDVKVPKPVIKYDTALTLLVPENNTPWDFYVQIFGNAYDQLMEELCLYFSRQASQGYRGGIINIPSPGCYCCAKSPIDGTWYRAQVMDVKSIDSTENPINTDYCPSESAMSCYEDPILNNFKAKVFLIDEGITNDVPLKNLRPLDPQFSQLPAQAIHCMLAGVGPAEDETLSGIVDWSDESIDWFKATISSEHFFTGYIHHAHIDGGCLPIDLYTGEQPVKGTAAALPPIDDNVGCMMLMVNMASPFSATPSHLRTHYKKIDSISYKPIVSENEFQEEEEEKPQNLRTETSCRDTETFQSVENNQSPDIKEPCNVELLARDVERIALAEATVFKQSVDKKLGKKESQVKNKPVETAKSDVTRTCASEAKISPQDLPRIEQPPAQNATFENKYKEKTFDVGQEGFCPVIVSSVNDPSLFYVHLITPDVALFGTMMDKLNSVYSITEFKVPEEHLNIGNAVVVRFSEDGKWYRGVIKHLRIPQTGIDSASGTGSLACQFEYEILHVDYGSFEWVKHAEVCPVIEEFFELPMETLPCCMADIEPMEISRDVNVPSSSASNGIANDRKRTFSREMKSKIKNRKDRKSSHELIEVAAGDEMFDDAFYTKELQVKWSEKAIERFRELTLDGQLRIASLKDNVSKHLPEDPWAVCLYNTNDDADVFINQVLVDEGLAVSHVYTKATEEKVYKKATRKVVVTEQELETALERSKDEQSPTSPVSPTNLLMNKWNPMEEAFHSYRNAYTIDIDDPGLATTGNVEPARNICRSFLSRAGCRRGASCHFEHARPSDPSRMKHEAFCTTVTEEQMSRLLPEFGEFVLVKVTVVISPLKFYVRLPFGRKPFGNILKAASFTRECNEVDELFELREKMNKMYASMPYKRSDIVVFLEGELIATKYAHDGHWYRARITKVLEREYEVFYIDYGNVEVVQEKQIRKLIPEFLFVDPQAMEVSLSGVEMNENVDGKGYTVEETLECLKEMLGDGVAIARVMSRWINGTLQIELFDKKTNVNIGKEMIQMGYFQPISTKKALSTAKPIKFSSANPRMIPA